DTELTEGYLNTTYERLRKYGANYNYYTFLSAFSDDAQDSSYPSEGYQMVARHINGDVSAASNPFEEIGVDVLSYNDIKIYSRNWVGIRQANVFLANVNDRNMPTQAHSGGLIAEAKLLRAMFYLDLLKLYGPMTIIKEDITMVTDFSHVVRNSFDECVALIVKDCDDALAEPYLPFRITSEAERGRMTKAVAHAIKSQVTLFNASPLWNEQDVAEKWQVASNASQVALESLTQAGFELFPNYENYFLTRPDLSADPNDKETLFEINEWGYSGQTYRRFSFILFLMHVIPDFGPEKAGNCPSQELVDTYDMANGEMAILGYEDEDHTKPIINPSSGYDDQNPYVNRDPRFYATVWYNGANYGVINGQNVDIEAYVGGRHGISGIKQRTPTGYYMRKFIDPKVRSAGEGSNTFKLFRLAEIYLNLAEAENEANGPTPIAYEAINTVRARANMPALPAGLSKEQFRERVRRERRVEFAMEEQRFYDVKRWKILSEVGKVTTGMQWTKNEDGQLQNKRI